MRVLRFRQFAISLRCFFSCVGFLRGEYSLTTDHLSAKIAIYMLSFAAFFCFDIPFLLSIFKTFTSFFTCCKYAARKTRTYGIVQQSAARLQQIAARFWLNTDQILECAADHRTDAAYLLHLSVYVQHICSTFLVKIKPTIIQKLLFYKLSYSPFLFFAFFYFIKQ